MTVLLAIRLLTVVDETPGSGFVAGGIIVLDDSCSSEANVAVACFPPLVGDQNRRFGGADDTSLAALETNRVVSLESFSSVQAPVLAVVTLTPAASLFFFGDQMRVRGCRLDGVCLLVRPVPTTTFAEDKAGVALVAGSHDLLLPRGRSSQVLFFSSSDLTGLSRDDGVLAFDHAAFASNVVFESEAAGRHDDCARAAPPAAVSSKFALVVPSFVAAGRVVLLVKCRIVAYRAALVDKGRLLCGDKERFFGGGGGVAANSTTDGMSNDEE
jgi:hypothetical protein